MAGRSPTGTSCTRSAAAPAAPRQRRCERGRVGVAILAITLDHALPAVTRAPPT